MASNHDVSLSSEEAHIHSYDGEKKTHDNVHESTGLEGYEQDFGEVKEMKQGLHQRHIQMIALAGTIGTGLFLSSGKAIARSGPLGAFLGYSIIGFAVSSVVFAVGEMGALVPLSGGIIRYAEYFCDPAMAFANGWNQVYADLVSVPAEIVAAAVSNRSFSHRILELTLEPRFLSSSGPP